MLVYYFFHPFKTLSSLRMIIALTIILIFKLIRSLMANMNEIDFFDNSSIRCHGRVCPNTDLYWLYRFTLTFFDKCTRNSQSHLVVWQRVNFTNSISFFCVLETMMFWLPVIHRTCFFFDCLIFVGNTQHPQKFWLGRWRHIDWSLSRCLQVFLEFNYVA